MILLGLRLFRLRGRGLLLVSDRASGRPQRGDIVLIAPPPPADQPILKKVVGLPGEYVSVKDGRIQIDGRPLPAKYVDPKTSLESAPDEAWELGPEEYAVVGEGKDASLDSGRLRPVRRTAVLGKVVWPRGR